MNAVEFVKKYGFDVGREYLLGLYSGEPVDVDTRELRTLVESYELVESYGGIAMAKRQYYCFANASESVGVNQSPRVVALGKAIADVEKCQ